MQEDDRAHLLQCLKELSHFDEDDLKAYITRRMNYDKIRVDDDSFVTHLDLSESGLKGKIPSRIGHFKRLLELNLSRNKLHGVLPRSLGNMHHLQVLNVSSNENLTGFLPAGIPQSCKHHIEHTDIVDIGGLRSKPLKPDNYYFDYWMIVLYITVTYIDLISDILACNTLFKQEGAGPVLATLNVFFIMAEAFMGLANSELEGTDIVLNLLFLQTAVDGINSLIQGKQTYELLAHKKLDAIARSLPGVALQFYSLLNGLNSIQGGDSSILLFSVITGVLGASFTLATSHPKAGATIASIECVLCILYYVMEIWTRVSIVAVGFLCLSGFGCLIAAADFAIRRYWIALDEDGKFDENNVNYSKTFLFLGSDNAVDEKRWRWGSLLNLAELMLFSSMMLFIPGVHITGSGFSVIPWPIEGTTTAMLLLSTLIACLLKVVAYYYIEYMEVKEEEEVDESAMAAGENDATVEKMVMEKANAAVSFILGASNNDHDSDKDSNGDALATIDEEAQIVGILSTKSDSRPSSPEFERRSIRNSRKGTVAIMDEPKKGTRRTASDDIQDEDSMVCEEEELVGTLRSRPSSRERRPSSRERRPTSREKFPSSIDTEMPTTVAGTNTKQVLGTMPEHHDDLVSDISSMV